MAIILRKTKNVLMELLQVDYGKTAAHLVEEVRVDYPALYKEIMVYYADQYCLGGCGLQMSPITVVQQTLAGLLDAGFVEKTQINGVNLWSKKQ